MPQVKGKMQLCVCKNYNKYYKSIQLLGGHTLFERYDDIDSVIANELDNKFRHFLAQPVVDGDDISWFTTPYSEKPRRLNELAEEEKTHYDKLKTETLGKYRSLSERLHGKGKTAESEAIERAIKFVSDDNVYCYDDKVVLGVWGMTPRENVHESVGVAMQDSFEPPRKQKHTASEPAETENEEENEDMVSDNAGQDDTDATSEEISHTGDMGDELYDVYFDDGGHGYLIGDVHYKKGRGDLIGADEIPQVHANDNYEFVGWSQEPKGYRISDDITFTARYRERGEKVTDDLEKDYIVDEQENIVASDDAGSTGGRFWWFRGCLNWLLLLLLLGLIFMLIWCFLLKRCPFNFCGCNCEDTSLVDSVTPDPPTPPDPPAPVPDPDPLKPCNTDVKSGHQEGYQGSFDMGQNTGRFRFEYATGAIYPDEIWIFDGEGTSGQQLFHYGPAVTGENNRKETATVQFHNPKITIIVKADNSSDTWWEFKVNCPE